MIKKIICDSCGAEFDNDEPKCPYCGTMNFDGAEKEYFEKLENVRADMEDLKEVSAEETKKEIKKQGGFIKKVAIIAIAIGLFLVGFHVLTEKFYERDEKEDFLWKSENYPIMDTMYENGEYDELLEFYIQAINEYRPVYDWEHYTFIDTYFNINEFYNDIEYLKSEEEIIDASYTLALSTQWTIIAASCSDELTEEEKAFFAEDFKVVEEHLKNDWGFDDETYQKFYNDAVELGYVNFEDCKDYVKDWLKGER